MRRGSAEDETLRFKDVRKLIRKALRYAKADRIDPNHEVSYSSGLTGSQTLIVTGKHRSGEAYGGTRTVRDQTTFKLSPFLPPHAIISKTVVGEFGGIVPLSEEQPVNYDKGREVINDLKGRRRSR